MKKILYALALTLICSACSAPFHAQAPRDFQSEINHSPQSYYAMNQFGIEYHVGIQNNDPAGNVEAWSKFYIKDLQSKGLVLINKERKIIAGSARESQQWAMPSEGPPILYWIWFRAGQKHLLIADCQASSEIMPRLFNDLINAADSLQFFEKDWQP